MSTPYQPIFTANDPPSDAELNFIEESPPGFFPENPESNVGLLRRIFSNLAQEAADELVTIYIEKFVANSQIYLDEWERQMGLPMTPNIDLAHRRARVLGRVQQGALSRAKRKAIIEQFIQATFGSVITFGPGGIVLGSGVPLHAAAGDVSQLYRVYEDVMTFSYQIWIDSTVGPDVTGLMRELTHVTPSGISFLLDTTTHTGTGLINWFNTVMGFAPNGFWPLGADYNDYSGLGHTGVVTGAPADIASPGLVQSAGGSAAKDFSGSGQYVTLSDSPRLNSNEWTIFAIIRPDTLPTLGNYRMIYRFGDCFFAIANLTGYGVRVTARVGDNVVNWTDAYAITPVVAGTVYRVAFRYDGTKISIFVNGYEEFATGYSVGNTSPYFNGSPYVIGSKRIAGNLDGTSLWDGALDEIIYFPYPLSNADILYLHKQASNLL